MTRWHKWMINALVTLVVLAGAATMAWALWRVVADMP